MSDGLMDRWLESSFGWFMGGLLLVMTLVLAVTVAGALLLSQASCDSTGRNTDHETRFDVIGGCFINVDGEWIPLKNWLVNSGN